MQLDYYQYVVAVYEKKIAKDDISRRLVELTPAQLRDACLDECKKRYSKKDARTLADFFGDAVDLDAHLVLIKRFDIDKFKPLIRYLKKETGNTNLINIELLAWLIDVPARPYNDRADYEKLKEELGKCEIKQQASMPEEIKSAEIIYGQRPANDIERQPEPGISQIVAGNKRTGITAIKQLTTGRKISLTIVLASIICCTGLVIYKIIDNKDNHRQYCMYWADDHYEPISCNQKMKGVLVIAFDSVRQHDFKRITKPDTITYSSIGHVWYSKMDNKVEFYTSAGNHPVKVDYQLHPVSIHMIDIYATKSE